MIKTGKEIERANCRLVFMKLCQQKFIITHPLLISCVDKITAPKVNRAISMALKWTMERIEAISF